MRYIVTALSVGGKGNKVFNSGDIVRESDFYDGHAQIKLESGHIKIYDRGDVVASLPSISFADKTLVIKPEGRGGSVFEKVAGWIEDKYKDKIDKEKFVIVIGYNEMGFTAMKSVIAERKIIVYQLEQLAVQNSMWWNEESHHAFVRDRTTKLKEWIRNADEVWDYSVENIQFLKDNGVSGDKIKFKPIEYSSKFSFPVYDAIFYGSINKRRLDILRHASKFFDICIIGSTSEDISKEEVASLNIKPSKFGEDLYGYISRSRVVLNIHYYEIQEQVRLCEPLANGHLVLSEKSPINYFGDLVSEFSTKDDLVEKLSALLTVNESKEDRVKKYQNHKFESESEYEKSELKIGVIYNSFYDTELIEASIKSLRPVIAYVAVIHQEVSFTGELASESALSTLKTLKNQGLIDDLVLVSPDDLDPDRYVAAIEKKNMGLMLCRLNHCDYVIPADNDEFYDKEILRDEVDRMHREGLQTLYSPILAYYHGTKYAFWDSYFVASVYKVDRREFAFNLSSILCDPFRKMQEGKYSLSDKLVMHHLAYMPDLFIAKGESNERNVVYKKEFEEVANAFKEWEDGNDAVVFGNDKKKGGAICVVKRPLHAPKNNGFLPTR